MKSVEEYPNNDLHIDLTGPNGTEAYLLGMAKDLSELLKKNYEEISKRMKDGDYENLIAVFEEEFGNIVTLYR